MQKLEANFESTVELNRPIICIAQSINPSHVRWRAEPLGCTLSIDVEFKQVKPWNLVVFPQRHYIKCLHVPSNALLTVYELLNFQWNALAVTVELRSVHALYLSHSSLIFTAQLDSRRILEHISPLAQVIDEEMAGGVFSGLVVT